MRERIGKDAEKTAASSSRRGLLGRLGRGAMAPSAAGTPGPGIASCRGAALIQPKSFSVPFVLAFCLAVAGPAAADNVITFTGEFEGFNYFSTRFDGTTYFNDELPPLFDVSRLAGGSFSASFLLPTVDPTFPGFYEFASPIPLTYRLFDAAGAMVHLGRSSISEALVLNDEEGRDPRSPRTDSVTFDGPGVGDVSGLVLPPELYGPNKIQDEYFFLGFGSRFTSGHGPIDDLDIPLDGDTYLAFAGRGFGLDLMIGNGEPDGPDPFLYVYTGLSYVITGATVEAASVPEPSTLVLLGTAAIVFAGLALRRGTARPAT